MTYFWACQSTAYVLLSHVGLPGVQENHGTSFPRPGISIAVQEEHSGKSVVLILSAVPLLPHQSYLHLKLRQLILHLHEIRLILNLWEARLSLSSLLMISLTNEQLPVTVTVVSVANLSTLSDNYVYYVSIFLG